VPCGERERADRPDPPGVHRLPLPTPFPVGPVNAYLLEGSPLTLVDPGPLYEPAREALLEGLARLGCAVADLGQIVITHPHLDHYGLAAELAEVSGAVVVAHSDARRRLEGSLYRGEDGERGALEEVLRRAGAPAEFGPALYESWRLAGALARPVSPGRLVEEGDTVKGGGAAWRVLCTPGHSPASICLHDEVGGRLISGDTLLERVSSNAIVEFRTEEGPPAGFVREKSLEVYIASLRRLAGLRVEVVLPGHGEPFTGHREIITARMAHYAARKEAILDILRRTGPATAYQVSRELFPGQTGVMGRFLALSEVLGHLDLLEADGRVERHLNGTVDFYRRAGSPASSTGRPGRDAGGGGEEQGY